jgi:PAS domain S-box-containing protein
MGDPAGIDTEAVVAIFEGGLNPSEPVEAHTVASRLGSDSATAESALERLVDEGELRSKQVGDGTTVWWRPPSAIIGSGRDGGPPPKPVLNKDAFLERVIEASPVSIVVVEPSGAIAFANRRAEETLGLERPEITTRTYSQPEWNIYHADGSPVSTDEHPVTRVLETGDPVIGFEHWIELPDGSERWLASNSAPILNDDGEVEYVVVGFADTTPLKHREEKLTSKQARRFELVSERLFEPFLDAIDGPFSVEVDEVVTSHDGGGLEYVTARNVEPNVVRAALEHGRPVRNVRLLRLTDDECRLELRVDSPTVPLVFASHGGAVSALVTRCDDGAPRLAGTIPGDASLRRVLEDVRRLYPDVELVSQDLVYSPRLLYDIVEGALTERQFAALQTAYYGGYFDTPRASTGDELAERIGITRQTFNQHLRKGERTVFSRLFESSGAESR